MRVFLFMTFVWLGSQLVWGQLDSKVSSGVVAYEGGEYEKALTYLDEALADPDKLKESNIPKAYYYRANARLKVMTQAAASGNAEKYGRAPLQAYEDLKKAHEADDGPWKAKIEKDQEMLFAPLLQGGLAFLSAAAQTQGNNREAYTYARRYLDATAELKPDNYLVYDLRGQALLGLKDTVAAYQDFKKAGSIFSENPSPQPDLLIGYVYYRRALIDRYTYNNPDDALKAIAKGKIQVESEWQRVLVKKDLFNQAQLDRFAEQFQNVKSDLATLELDIYLNFPEKKQEALQKFEQAIQEDPQNYIKHIAYAQLLEEENPEKAKETYRQAIQIDPDYSLAYFNLGAMYNNEAAEWYAKANEASELKQSNWFQEKGQAAFQAALPLFEKAHVLEPENRSTLRALLQICISLDEMEKYNLYNARLKALR